MILINKFQAYYDANLVGISCCGLCTVVNNRFINKIVCSSKFKSDNGIHIVLIDFKSSNNIVGIIIIVVYNSVAINIEIFKN